MNKTEFCELCHDHTERAGLGEDSLYAAYGTPAEVGPLCLCCYNTLTNEPEREKLRDKIETLENALLRIADFAHDKSTGPAVPDGLWEVRSIAYEAFVGES